MLGFCPAVDYDQLGFGLFFGAPHAAHVNAVADFFVWVGFGQDLLGREDEAVLLLERLEGAVDRVEVVDVELHQPDPCGVRSV